MAVVERFKQESMYVNVCPPKKVAVAERWPLVKVRLYQQSMTIFVGELATCE